MIAFVHRGRKKHGAFWEENIVTGTRIKGIHPDIMAYEMHN